ncbi:MAG: hypothetical protein P8X42_01080 [Calditrichaceae bacterium]|jgi:hypothetical protein
MKKYVVPSTILFFLIFQSCLTYRSVEYRIIFNENFDRGTISVNYNDIQSTEDKIEKRKKDFDDLIDLLFGDDFLLDNVDEGIYVKDRKLWKENNTLRANFSGIFQDLKLEDSELKIENDERMLILKNNGDTYECNGKLLQTDNNVIMVWPKDQKELYWKQNINLENEFTFPLIDYYNNWKAENN